LEIVSDKAGKPGACRVKNIVVSVGELSGVEPDSVSLYFDLLKKEYNLENATISFTPVPAMMKCGKCGKEFNYDPLSWDCPSCGDRGIAISMGTECYVDSMEVEE